ncbi:MAG: arabinofuranosyltransferase [Streptosporangiales bacterium]|nr:arabinofuranosyltransferase [Streptosporangiales bacterium]
MATWLLCLPAAFGLATLGPADPFQLRVAMIPVVLGVGGVVIVGLISRRLPADLASGIGAGLVGGWIAFTLRVALHGTPYGFDGLRNDAGRLAAMATAYSRTWHSSDGIVRSVPSDYPPLFPWLVGRTSALTHIPAWRLLGPAETVMLSFAVVAGYLLWRYLVPGPIALALALPVLLCFSDPAKGYEILALEVFVPWAIAAFGDPPRGRMHWLPAGLIGGLSIPLYWVFISFGAIGILSLAALTWWSGPDRARYARHLALTAVVAAVVASWYLIPLLGWGLMHGSSLVGDQYQGLAGDPNQSLALQNSPLIFLSPTPLGVLELTGLLGLVWYRGRVWWGKPLLLLTGSTYAYWLLGLAAFVVANHKLQVLYTPRLAGPLLAAAGVLTLARLAAEAARRLTVRSVPAGLPTLALCLLVTFTGLTAWQEWMPGGPGENNGLYQPSVSTVANHTTFAFTSPLPDGSYSPAAPSGERDPSFPTSLIQKDVRSVLGPGAEPVTLSDSENLFAFTAWPGYIAAVKTAAGTATDWPARYAALAKLSHVTGPAAFSTASGSTAFGPVDVFILQVAGPARWDWVPEFSSEPPVTFTPAQFTASDFAVFKNLPGNYVLAVRRSAHSG